MVPVFIWFGENCVYDFGTPIQQNVPWAPRGFTWNSILILSVVLERWSWVEPRNRQTDRQTLWSSVTVVCISCIRCSLKRLIFTPRAGKTYEPISFKLEIYDYARDPTPHDKFGGGSSVWVVCAKATCLLFRFLRLHRMHELQTIVTDVCVVCPSVSLSVTQLNVCDAFVQPLPNYFGLLFAFIITPTGHISWCNVILCIPKRVSGDLDWKRVPFSPGPKNLKILHYSSRCLPQTCTKLGTNVTKFCTRIANRF